MFCVDYFCQNKCHGLFSTVLDSITRRSYWRKAFVPGLKHNSISGISCFSRRDAFEMTTNPLSLCGAINKGEGGSDPHRVTALSFR